MRATLARTFASYLHPATQAESFTAGLLQDLALPFLVQARTTDYGDILQQWHGLSDSSLIELERQTLSWTHAEIGAALARSWALPDYLEDAIAAHHSIEQEAPVEAAVRLVADLREDPENSGVEELIASCIDQTDLSEEVIRGAVEEAHEQASELNRLLN